MIRWIRFVGVALLLVSGAASAGALRGAILVAADGTFLGTCDGRYGSTSIANEYSQYGGKYGSNSIFNTYGTYGSAYSTYSAFNKYTTSAPYLLAADANLLRMFTDYRYRPTPEIVRSLESSGATRVSANPYLSRAIDPNVLRVACENP